MKPNADALVWRSGGRGHRLSLYCLHGSHVTPARQPLLVSALLPDAAQFGTEHHVWYDGGDPRSTQRPLQNSGRQQDQTHKSVLFQAHAVLQTCRVSVGALLESPTEHLKEFLFSPLQFSAAWLASCSAFPSPSAAGTILWRCLMIIRPLCPSLLWWCSRPSACPGCTELTGLHSSSSPAVTDELPSKRSGSLQVPR